MKGVRGYCTHSYWMSRLGTSLWISTKSALRRQLRGHWLLSSIQGTLVASAVPNNEIRNDTLAVGHSINHDKEPLHKVLLVAGHERVGDRS